MQHKVTCRGHRHSLVSMVLIWLPIFTLPNATLRLTYHIPSHRRQYTSQRPTYHDTVARSPATNPGPHGFQENRFEVSLPDPNQLQRNSRTDLSMQIRLRNSIIVHIFEKQTRVFRSDNLKPENSLKLCKPRARLALPTAVFQVPSSSPVALNGDEGNACDPGAEPLMKRSDR